jgi:hypothetical protein
MKMPFSNADCRLPIADVPANPQAAIFNRKSQIANRKFQRGVALVITLILLAVVTVMAVAFLANSRRERGSVATTTDTAGARLAADAALAAAESQIMANVLATTNPYNFGLVVSTNYINSFGLIPGEANPTNVNYDYLSVAGTYTANDREQNIANLLYSPRAPVFVPSPPGDYSSPTNYDFRFYLDLNRNGTNDSSGWITNVNNLGQIILNGDGSPSTNLQVGDPEWIGVLDHPDQPHGPNNHFIARYAFVAVPIGNALDLNAIYNDAMQPGKTMLGGNDGFMRNQGVGSWEINLAAFLADLNTNQWLPTIPPNNLYYAYNPPPLIGGNSGFAFEDALSLLKYRYVGINGTYNDLASVQDLFGTYGATVFQNDDIDGYSDGPLMTNTFLPPENDVATLSWAGADNTNQFFDMQELFNPNESLPDFTNRLLNAGNGVSTYDRYTFYRLMSQMGVDSAPEQDKMNLNYDNLDVDPATGTASATNFVPWTALGFFTNAADRMLRAYSQDWLTRDPSNYVATYGMTEYPGVPLNATNPPVPFGITDIPVSMGGVNVYSSAINRVLQLAANMYDATTNNTFVMGRDFPSVFRPTFNVVLENGYTNVYVNGYEQVFSVSGLNDPIFNLPYDVNALAPDLGFGTFTNVNVYGVPWIIGAKKGFPNFNEFAMENAFQLTRKLQVTRASTNATITPITSYKVNQMFNLSVTNQLGVECWNSYASNFNDSVAIRVTDVLTNVVLANDEGFSTTTNFVIQVVTNIDPWQGYNPIINPVATPMSFLIPLNTNVVVITNSMYRFNNGDPYLTTNLSLPYESNVVFNGSSYPQPNWSLAVTNNLQVIMLDVTASPYRVIDYVQLRGPNSSRTNLNAEIQAEQDTGNLQGYNGLWLTNLDGQGVPFGLDYQLGISLGSYGLGGTGPNAWNQVDPTEAWNEINGFRAFYHYGPDPNHTSFTNDIGLDSTTNNLQAPYTPTATTVQHITWQANDPLVHYIASDLNTPVNTNIDSNIIWPANLGALNDRYMPWGGNPLLKGADHNPYYLALKDPLVTNSDSWDFPTYKFPTVGWLGRVHRGTPWQTVDMKSALPDILTWTNWTGDLNPFDADNSSPSADWQLFDLFTTAFNDNATRGQLSVNVGAPNGPNLAAWSALFSGIVVPTNTIGGYTIIQPAGPDIYNIPSVWQVVTNINATRTNFVNADGLKGAFEHVGDILATPDLTVSNPWLLQNNNTNTINDELYEWLPQQVMSLLRVSGTPQSPMRYVIYCYGQTLKPAPNGIVTSGSEFGLCTNYQVVAEADTRAVVQFGSVVTNIPAMTNINGNLYWPNTPVPPSVTNNNAVIKSFNVLPSN